MLGGLALRIFTASDPFLHTWDEGYHALVAKNLMQHPFKPTLYAHPILPFDYKDWTANHIWLHKQPVPLWTMAMSMSLFGINLIALRLPSTILSTLGIGLTYYTGKHFFSKRAGFLAAFFYAINGLILEMSGGRVATDHYDIFFLFFVHLAIVFSIIYVRKRKSYFNILVGLALGIAILCKWLPALIVLPVWVFLVLDTQKIGWRVLLQQLLLILIVSSIIFVPWQIYIHLNFPLEAAWESGYNIKHLTQALEGRTGPWYFFFDRIRINYGELIYLPLLWFFWKIYKDRGNFKQLALLSWWLVPFVFFSLSQTKMPAYILFTAPVLFLISAEFFFIVYDKRHLVESKWLVYTLLLLLLALPIRYSLERMKPFAKTQERALWIEALVELDEQYEYAVLFNFPKPIDAMFYTDMVVYKHIPSLNTILELQSKGMVVLFSNPESIPAEYKDLKGALYLSLPFE